MKKTIFAALVALVPFFAPAIACAGSVTAVIEHVPSDKGHVLVAICTKAQFLGEHCAYQGMVKSAPGTVRVTIPNVAPGVYALQAFQDANDNGKVDRNMVGMPTEPLGFSRNAKIWFGPPRFADAAVVVGNGDGVVSFAIGDLK